MAELNRKAVRTCAAKYAQESDEALLAHWAQKMTAEEAEALQRTARARNLTLPAEHGAVEDDPTISAPKKIISLEELAATDAKTQESVKFGLGWSEGISLFAGVAVALALWASHKGVALLYGIVIAVVLYGILHYARRTWKELGEPELRGTDTSLRGRKKQ